MNEQTARIRPRSMTFGCGTHVAFDGQTLLVTDYYSCAYLITFDRRKWLSWAKKIEKGWGVNRYVRLWDIPGTGISQYLGNRKYWKNTPKQVAQFVQLLQWDGNEPGIGTCDRLSHVLPLLPTWNRGRFWGEPIRDDDTQ